MNISRSLYRGLLRLCPPDLRAEFGAEMEELFVNELGRARGLGKTRVWTRAIADVLRHGTGARNDAWHRHRKTSAYVEYAWRIAHGRGEHGRSGAGGRGDAG